jgi:hypothetical protein
MIGIGVKLNPQDVRKWLKALNSVEYRARWWLKAGGGELNRRLSVAYSNKVVANILSNKWSFVPYKERYAKWKKDAGLGSEPFWKLKGDLVQSITNFRESKGWTGGIPANVVDSGGKSWFHKLNEGKIKRKRIAMIGTVLEFGGDYTSSGGGFHHKRPVLANTLDEFELQNYSGIPGLMMNDIERAWS